MVTIPSSSPVAESVRRLSGDRTKTGRRRFQPPPGASFPAAVAFIPFVDGSRLHFEVRDGRIVDVETGSRWRLDGLATGGPLAGHRLEPVRDAFVSFWFAYQPETRIWTREG